MLMQACEQLIEANVLCTRMIEPLNSGSTGSPGVG